MVAWLDHAQATDLRSMVQARATDAARHLLRRAGVDLPEGFDLEYRHWRGPLLRELDLALEIEDTTDDASTASVPDYARFATDLRELHKHKALVEKLVREADVDLGAAFGWED